MNAPRTSSNRKVFEEQYKCLHKLTIDFAMNLVLIHIYLFSCYCKLSALEIDFLCRLTETILFNVFFLINTASRTVL